MVTWIELRTEDLTILVTRPVAPRAAGRGWFFALYFTGPRISIRLTSHSFSNTTPAVYVGLLYYEHCIEWKLFVWCFLPPSLIDCVQETHIIRRSALRFSMFLFLYARMRSKIVSLLMISVFERGTSGWVEDLCRQTCIWPNGYRFLNLPVLGLLYFYTYEHIRSALKMWIGHLLWTYRLIGFWVHGCCSPQWYCIVDLY
jgi:hypothetical protein